MRALINLAIAALCITGLSSCSPQADERYLITGSSTVAPILQQLAERIEERDPSLRIDVQTGGTSRGIVDVAEGRSDAGMASRDLRPEELAGIAVVPIAFDGVAIIAHAANPTTGLDADQVRGLFTKRIGGWEEIGDHQGKVVVVNKAEGRATLEVFLEHFGLEARAIQADVVIGDNAQGIRLVAADEQAIGYVSIGEALHAIGRGVPIRLLALDGVVPTLESVADGSYPIRRTLYLLLPEVLGERDERLLEHVRGPMGRRVIEELRFIPISVPPG